MQDYRHRCEAGRPAQVKNVTWKNKIEGKLGVGEHRNDKHY